MSTAVNQPAETPLEEWVKPPFLRRVRIQGYKSIAYCDVQLQPLTVLVGRNGSGKSNFLDALAFLRDALQTNLAEAIKERGGLQSILCRTLEMDRFSIRLEMGGNDPSIHAEFHADYQLTVQIDQAGRGFEAREKLTVRLASGEEYGFQASDGKVWINAQFQPSGDDTKHESPWPEDVLFLNVFFLEPISQFSTFLRNMNFYNFYPLNMRKLQKPNPGYFLEPDGFNIASVLKELWNRDNNASQRLQTYLTYIVPEVAGIEPITYGDYEVARFHMHTEPGKRPRSFDAAAMSDGTLRALGALAAAFQVNREGNHPTVIGIEEPETSLHPAATQALVDALDEATSHTQVILTTHSADLLDDPDIKLSQVLVVRMRNGQTQIGPVDPASKEIIRKELYTLADLQRMDQLNLDEIDLERQLHSMNGEA